MEAHEEVDIVIGDKKECLCDTVTEFTNTETGIHATILLFLRQERSGGFSIYVRPPSIGRYEFAIVGKHIKSEKS